MFFDHRRAESDGGDADADAVGVVREADLAAEELAQVGDGSQIAVLRAGRVGAGAFEQHDVVAAALAQGPYGFVELGEGGHAGRIGYWLLVIGSQSRPRAGAFSHRRS